MADCECLVGCIFFNDKMERMPTMADMYKTKYCKGNAEDCARYTVFKKLGKGKVPVDLYPNQTEKAKALIS